MSIFVLSSNAETISGYNKTTVSLSIVAINCWTDSNVPSENSWLPSSTGRGTRRVISIATCLSLWECSISLKRWASTGLKTDWRSSWSTLTSCRSWAVVWRVWMCRGGSWMVTCAGCTRCVSVWAVRGARGRRSRVFNDGIRLYIGMDEWWLSDGIEWWYWVSGFCHFWQISLLESL